MAYNNPGNPGNDSDMYSDEPSGTTTDETEESSSESDQPSAVLPRSILAGKKFDVGDEVVLKITAMHEDQIEVEYAPAKGKESGKEEGGYGGGDSEMESMME